MLLLLPVIATASVSPCEQKCCSTYKIKGMTQKPFTSPDGGHSFTLGQESEKASYINITAGDNPFWDVPEPPDANLYSISVYKYTDPSTSESDQIVMALASDMGIGGQSKNVFHLCVPTGFSQFEGFTWSIGGDDTSSTHTTDECACPENIACDGFEIECTREPDPLVPIILGTIVSVSVLAAVIVIYTFTRPTTEVEL